MRHLALVSLLILALSGATALAQAKKPTNLAVGDKVMVPWGRDNTGKFKVEARFVELKCDQLTLERSDGSKVTVGLNRLSDADQKVAKDTAKEADEEDALAPYQRPNLQFFTSAKIPQYLARPHEKGAYGATQLTPQGPLATEVIVPKPKEGS